MGQPGFASDSRGYRGSYWGNVVWICNLAEPLEEACDKCQRFQLLKIKQKIHIIGYTLNMISFLWKLYQFIDNMTVFATKQVGS